MSDDATSPVTDAERQRARDALAERRRLLDAAHESGHEFPHTSPGKFDGFAPGVDDDGNPYPPPRRPRDPERT